MIQMGNILRPELQRELTALSGEMAALRLSVMRVCTSAPKPPTSEAAAARAQEVLELDRTYARFTGRELLLVEAPEYVGPMPSVYPRIDNVKTPERLRGGAISVIKRLRDGSAVSTRQLSHECVVLYFASIWPVGCPWPIATPRPATRKPQSEDAS